MASRPRSRTLTVQPPLAGIERQLGFQNQAPFTTIESVNFWPIDVRTGRAVTATRPPLNDVTSPGTAINMICRASGVTANGPLLSMVAARAGTLYYWDGDSWVAATVTGGTATLTSDRAVYAAPFLGYVFIANNTTPLVYNYVSDSLDDLVASAGTVPADFRVVANWQGGIWVAGQPNTPHILAGSRIGDGFDWDFTKKDNAAAFTTTGEKAGVIIEPISALMPQTSNTMIVGTPNGLWALRGHPRRDGFFDALSSKIGPMGQGAWAKTPDDSIYMLTSHGLAKLPPQAGAIPTLVSAKKIPSELIGLAYDYDEPTVSMAYCGRWNALYIAVRGTQKQAWKYDLTNGGFHQMEFSDYPNVMASFEEFQTEGASSVLWGGDGYGGLARFDRSGEENIPEPRIVIGPIQLTHTTSLKAKIVEADIVLGGGTDDIAGELRIVTGKTAEDAYARYVAGNNERAYDVTLSTLQRNSGKCYPGIAGHAAVIRVKGDDSGDPISFESMSCELEPAGRERPTSTFIAQADPSEESLLESNFVFDPVLLPTPPAGGDPPLAPTANWVGYVSCLPIIAPGSTLTDFTHFIDLSRFPADWWTNAMGDGRDVHPTTAAGVGLPYDLIHFDKVNRVGFLAVKLTQTTSPVAIRVYVGRSINTFPEPDDPRGQYNAYDASWMGFWPNGAGNDRTLNQRHLDHFGSPALFPGNVSGIAGMRGTHYNGLNNFARVGLSATNVPFTFIGWGRKESAVNAGGAIGIIESFQTSISGSSSLQEVSFANDLSSSSKNIFASSGGSAHATSNTAYVVDTYRHFAGKWVSASERYAYLNGSPGSVSSTTKNLRDSNALFLGARPAISGTPNSWFFNGDLVLVQAHSVARHDDFILWQAIMDNQATFYDTLSWTASVLAGVSPTGTGEDTPDGE